MTNGTTTTTDTTTTDTTTRRPLRTALIGPHELASQLDDPRVRVIEVDVSPATYAQGHVEGAVLWNIYADLKDSQYHLRDRGTLERLVAHGGVGPDTTVVFYGHAPALGVWLLDHMGHDDARILDCSRDTWKAAGLPWSDVVTEPVAAAPLAGAPNDAARAERAEVLDALARRESTLLDVRSMAEYVGERFWPSGGMDDVGRAGHIPTAVHTPLDDLSDERGAFRDADELRRHFPAIDLDADDDVITYCTIGARAATAWFVLDRLLGRRGVRVYEGSWAEWGRSPGSPVEAGTGV
jgi:thiosulfate/3-mercaptopyruvate sulfurtransferase